MTEAKDQARERELATTVALYNAATDYAAYVNSNRRDYDEAMKLSDALKAAAVAYAELAGDREPTMPKTPAISTLASSNGSLADERSLSGLLAAALVGEYPAEAALKRYCATLASPFDVQVVMAKFRSKPANKQVSRAHSRPTPDSICKKNTRKTDSL